MLSVVDLTKTGIAEPVLRLKERWPRTMRFRGVSVYKITRLPCSFDATWTQCERVKTYHEANFQSHQNAK